jgi:hypothetical protein
LTDETPRNIRLRPGPSAEEVHEVEVFILQKEMLIMELDLKCRHSEVKCSTMELENSLHTSGKNEFSLLQRGGCIQRVFGIGDNQRTCALE